MIVSCLAGLQKMKIEVPSWHRFTHLGAIPETEFVLIWSG